MNTRKKLGILGGMGARAGSVLLQKVIDYSPVYADQDFIEIILHNNPYVPDRTKAILYNGLSPEQELTRSINFFTGNGVDVIILACITSYYYYDRLIEHTGATILHPVDILARHLAINYPRVKRIGLLASTGALQSGIFHNRLKQYGIAVVQLNDTDQEELFMRSLYMPNGLKSGTISAAAKELFFESVEKIQRQHIELLVGGCSEVSILLDQNVLPVSFVDIMDLLARQAVHYCYNLSHISN